MNVLILQPPLVQLNTAYPSGAYLSAFFKKQSANVRWFDLSIALYYKLFSPSGLETLFSLCKNKTLLLANEAEKNGDDSTAFNLRRYISQKESWCSWIETITSLLTAGGKKTGAYESAHRFVFSAYAPRGNRMDSYLANLDHALTTDDARPLASLALADLADFITAVFDKNFSLIRYAESLTVSETDFSEIEKAAEAPVLTTFYQPVLDELFSAEYGGYDGKASPIELIQNNDDERALVCISVPFAGTFAAALATGKYVKEHFGERVFVCMGGGFINTELRETTECKLYDYCDALSYDRGYGSYKSLFDSKIMNKLTSDSNIVPTSDSQQGTCISAVDGIKLPVVSLYKMKRFLSTGCINEMASGVTNDCKYSSGQNKQTDANSSEYKKYSLFEKEQTAQIVPDYSDIYFFRYPRLIDDTNAMHRLWSDGAWIKAYLAHGCYWHQCEFCDVTLDYVCGYQMADVHTLYEKLLETAKEKNVYGIHFVDEAAPPVALVLFAKENIAHGCPLTFWGNIRFEKTFTRDVADYLAYGGLVGVSAGIEIATGSGLDEIHKGTDIDSIVGACCAFKEAGILVHAYMIYGYWQQNDQDCINSMETLRQFYDAGLLDSSFWHKFVLTRHSRVYKEWKEGKHADLMPVEPKNAGLFAKNGLHFKGEEKSEKFGPGLDAALESWMHGKQLKKDVAKWFEFTVPRPAVQKNCIENAIARYEAKRDKEFAEPVPENKKRIVWLGGEKINKSANKRICWMYMGEMNEADVSAKENEFRGQGLCVLPDWSVLK
jgi:hypothetical protein